MRGRPRRLTARQIFQVDSVPDSLRFHQALKQDQGGIDRGQWCEVGHQDVRGQGPQAQVRKEGIE